MPCGSPANELPKGNTCALTTLPHSLDLAPAPIRRWLADGTLPSVKIGGARLVSKMTF